MFHRQELLRRGHTVDATQQLLQTSDAGMYVWGAHDREAPAVACDSIECLNFARTVAFSHYLQGMYDGWQPPRRCVRTLLRNADALCGMLLLLLLTCC